MFCNFYEFRQDIVIHGQPNLTQPSENLLIEINKNTRVYK